MGLVLFKARVVMALARWSSKNSVHMSIEVSKFKDNGK